MAVVKNLMIRIGADFSEARKGMQGATRELGRFKRDTKRAANDISGRRGVGGISSEFKNLGGSVSNSLSQIRGAKGIGGVTSSLRTMKPVVADAVAGLIGMSAAAEGVGLALGPVGIAVGTFIAVTGLATAAIAKASQTAVRFEADLGRLNMQLKGSTRNFMEWAEAQGLAKSTSAQLGSTYAVLLSSFTKDNKVLANQTKQLVQTTRIVASATGRTIEDTTERIRSGLLGNTEAVEDLGIFVNVSMIESTKAFKKFANGKHWEQLDFKVQQQIRLAAILEQAYDRYGNKLQDNVMTKQTDLIEQLKDIKLTLSQAFLPLWDTVLPALTKLAEGVGYVTEQIARFAYWVKGWNYDEMTKGTDDQADSVDNLGDSLDKTTKEAQKALAAFDELNLIGGPGSGGGSAGTGSGGLDTGTDSSSNNNGGLNLPDLPPSLPELQLKFKTPSPPDAGMGAVATAVNGTVNSLTRELQKKWDANWNGLSVRSRVGSLDQQAIWANMMNGLQFQTETGGQAINQQWTFTFDAMKAKLMENRPVISDELNKMGQSVSGLSEPLAKLRTDWHETLGYQQEQLNAFRPYLEWGWHLIGASIGNTKPVLEDTRMSWETNLSAMQLSTSSNLDKINADIRETTRAYQEMQRAISGATAPTRVPDYTPTPTPPKSSPSGNTAPATTPSGSSLKGRDLAIIGPLLRFEDKIAKYTKPLSEALQPFLVPGAGLGGLGGGLRGAGSAAVSKLNQALNALKGFMQGMGGAIPGFKTGAVVYGPTLAMVGDNPGARNDPEVISPLSKLEGMIDGGNDSQAIVQSIERVEQAVREIKQIQAVISSDAVGRASTDFINDSARRRGRNPLYNL